MKSELAKYVELIRMFLAKEIPVQTFEADYLKMVKNENCIFGESIDKLIGTLFSDVDAYCGDPSIADYNPLNLFHDIDERELRLRAKKTLDELLKFL